MLYVLIDSTGKQRIFHVQAVADLFQTLYGGEVHRLPLECS